MSDADEIRKDLDRITKRLNDEPMDRADIPQKIEEARAWLTIMEESQKTREKYGQKLGTDFQLERGNDAASVRVILNDLEKAVYGGFLNALRKRLENVERAFLEAQEGTQQ